MKKDKQLLVRVSKEEFDYITQLSNIEGKSISCIIRELINYRYSYLKRNNKITCKASKNNNNLKNSDSSELDENILNEFKSALNLS